MTEADVAIIGAGLAGSGMAHAMASRGWRTVLFDRPPSPRRKVCGEFLSPEARGTLASLGLLVAVEALGPAEMDKARLYAAGGASLALPLPGTALGVSRRALDRAVRQAALERGAEWIAGAWVTSVRREGRGYRIEWRGDGQRRTMEAPAVIGAWGRHPVPGLTATARPNGTRPADVCPNGEQPDRHERDGNRQDGFRPDVARRFRIRLGRAHPGGARPARPAALHRGSLVGVSVHVAGLKPERAVELYFFPGGYAGLAPIEGGRHNLAALVTRRAFQDAGGTVRGVLAAATRGNGALRRRLAGGTILPGTEAAVAPVAISRRPIPWGVVPHLGDAAAVVPPLCGDGMAMALRSAALCAPLADGYLRGTLTLDEWRRAYSSALLAQWAGPLRWGNALQRLAGTPALLAPLLGAGRFAPGVARFFVRATRLRP